MKSKAPAAPLPSWRVIKEFGNDGRVYGARRALNEIFEAPEAAVQAYLNEAIIEPAGTPAAAPAAEAA